MILKVVKQIKLFPLVDLPKQVVSYICTQRKNAYNFRFRTYLCSVCGPGTGAPRLQRPCPGGHVQEAVTPPHWLLQSPHPASSNCTQPREPPQILQSVSHLPSWYLPVPSPCAFQFLSRFSFENYPSGKANAGPVPYCFAKDLASSEICSLSRTSLFSPYL